MGGFDDTLLMYQFSYGRITIFGNWRFFHDFETPERHNFQIKIKENQVIYIYIYNDNVT